MRNIFYLVCFLYNVENFSNDRCQCCNCCNEEAPKTEEEIKNEKEGENLAKKKEEEEKAEEERKKKEEEEILTEEEIKKVEECHGEPKEITPTKEGVLQHLKLDGDKLKDIINEVNNAGDNIAKINKIIQYSKDIDWDNPMCPNTLIKQEHNACSIISYFHLMLNNPYFVKFFLICDKIESLHGEDTYMLDAICDLVRWCVNHPKFDKNENNMGSVEPILNALFIKENGEYFYCIKEKERNLGNDLYTFFNIPCTASDGHIYYHRYGSFLHFSVHLKINICLNIDLNINEIETNLFKEQSEILKTNYIIERLLGISKQPSEEEIEELQNFHKNLNYTEGEEDRLLPEDAEKIYKLYFETIFPKIHKLLGVFLSQYAYHYFVFINYNGVWYNKNTLNKDECGVMPKKEVLNYLKEILKIKNPKEQDLNQDNCFFEYVSLLEP